MHVVQLHCRCSRLAADFSVRTHFSVITRPPQEAIGHPRRAPRPAGDFHRPLGRARNTHDARRTHHDPLQFLLRVQLEDVSWIPKRSRRGEESSPARVVAPTSVNGLSFNRMVWADGPSPITISSRKSSMAGYNSSCTTGLRRCTSSTNSTSRALKLVSRAARSPGRSSTGPDVCLNPTPNSRAITCARVVFSQARRTVQQRVIHGLATLAGRRHADFYAFLDLPLAQEFRHALRPNGILHVLFFRSRLRRQDALAFDFFAHDDAVPPDSASRTSSSTSRPAGSPICFSIRLASTGV